MRYIVKFKVPIDAGNTNLRDPKFGEKMHQLLADIRAEAAYFCPVDGQRGGYAVIQMNDASQIAAVAEPFFFWLRADVEFIPVMTAEDLAKAGPAIESSLKKWG